MKYYKLLKQDMTSHNKTKWEINKTITITKEGTEMCTNQVLHCYNHPLLAIMFNPIHADIMNPRLFEIEVDKIVITDGLKYASKSQTLIKEIDVPEISVEQKVEFAIRVAQLVYKNTKWNKWADNWLNNTDRTQASARTAANAAYAAAAAAYAAAYYASAAAAAYATYATNAAYAASDARAAYAAVHAVLADASVTDKNEFNKQMIEIIESIIH